MDQKNKQAIHQTPDDALTAKTDVDQNVKIPPSAKRTHAVTSGEIPRTSLVATRKTITKKILFFIPVIFLLVGLVVYFIVIPAIYGQTVSFFDWLFADPQHNISVLQNPYVALSKAHLITEIRVFWYIWLMGFTVSLFFVGRQLNHKPAPTAMNAILGNREPYLLACDVQDSLKVTQNYFNCDEFSSLLYAVKCLVEELSVESGFGYGNISVTMCENNITKQLQLLLELVNHVDKNNATETMEKMQLTINSIHALLRCRAELKRK
ncbi:hypothetical protein [Acutalibacter caecimuris]|uniref:hypothetical protein n=1 Tax=Acutalibacter caecimuris TaxID=3093657 RepID=UPI002AC9B317|nr:hypothetical protein [Acutalibacter sp. M00118]